MSHQSPISVEHEKHSGSDVERLESTGDRGDTAGSTDLLAKRMGRWAGNLLATSVIVILGLTFGSQVLQWWRGDPPVVTIPNDMAQLNLGGLTDPSLPHLLAFGDLPFSLERRDFEGNEEEALAALREYCREPTDTHEGTLRTIDASEQQLKRLRKCSSVEKGNGWRIVQERGPVLTVVALRSSTNDLSSSLDDTGQEMESVVSWGLGLRRIETEEGATSLHWTLFTCSGQDIEVSIGLDLPLQLPQGCRRTFAMRVHGGGAMIGFSCNKTISSVRRHYESFFEHSDWERQAVWTQIGTTWHARFEKAEVGVCDVQLVANAEDVASGILTITTVAQSSER